jgi:hypothetical protein
VVSSRLSGFKKQFGLTGRPNSWKLKHKKGRLWKIKKRKKIFSSGYWNGLPQPIKRRRKRVPLAGPESEKNKPGSG